MRKITISDNMTPISRMCVEKNITKKQLAELSDVPLSTIDQYSRRLRRNPNVYQLYKIAQVFGCHIEDLIEPELEE